MKKINLDDLKLESFATILDEVKLQEIKGGAKIEDSFEQEPTTKLNGDCYSNNCSVPPGCSAETSVKICGK